jgi:hypothetical protein
MIHSLAKKTWEASHKEPRVARTVVLKLKTSAFKTLTRSYTPPSPPSSCEGTCRRNRFSLNEDRGRRKTCPRLRVHLL